MTQLCSLRTEFSFLFSVLIFSDAILATSAYSLLYSCPKHSDNDISALKEMEDEKDFIKFFLDSDNFDYKKVDFSNYMWENIARREKFMTQFVAHKDDIIPNIQRKVNLDKATEFERKCCMVFF